MIQRIILLALSLIPFTSWGALREFGSPKASPSELLRLLALQEQLGRPQLATSPVQPSPSILLNDCVLDLQPGGEDTLMLDVGCPIAQQQARERQQRVVRILRLDGTDPLSDRMHRQLRVLQASHPLQRPSLRRPAESTGAATALPEEFEAASAERTKRPCTAQPPADIANAEIVFVEPAPVSTEEAPPSPAKQAAQKAVQKAQRALEQIEKMKAVRYEECKDALRTIQEELDRSDNCNMQTVDKMVFKINFLMAQCEKSTDKEFIDRVHHLHSAIMGTLNVLAKSPIRPKQAKKTQVTPKRPKTPREVADGVQRVFDLDANADMSRIRGRLAAITPPATSLHQRLLPGLNVRHIEEGHVISDMSDLIMHNTAACRGVYESRVNQVVCAMNPYVWEKPQKTFYPQRIAATDADDHIVGKILLTLDDTERTQKIATQAPFMELFYSNEFGFPFVLVTRETYQAEGCLQGARKRSQTLYPIFALVEIDESTPECVRLVDATILNPAEIKQDPQFLLTMDRSDIVSLITAMKKDIKYKSDHYVSVNSDYIIVDIAPWLHQHRGCPIEHGILVRVKKTLLPSDY